MRGWVVALLAGLVIAVATVSAAQQRPEGAEAFVRGVFAGYADGDDAAWPLADGWLDAVWSPRMAALIRRDRALADGDPPYLDADPLCNCQDWERLTVRTVSLSDVDATGVTATVAFTNGGQGETTVLRLRRHPVSAWRIDDVLGPGGPGLAERLAASNRGIEQGRRALDRD